MKAETAAFAGPDPEEFIRLPGLYRRWEIEQVVEQGSAYHIEGAGAASDGTPLFAVFRQELLEDKEART